MSHTHMGDPLQCAGVSISCGWEYDKDIKHIYPHIYPMWVGQKRETWQGGQEYI